MPVINPELLSPALQGGLQLLRGAYPAARGALERLGGVFQDLAKRAPGYFETGRELPTGQAPLMAADALRAKHGLGSLSGFLSEEGAPQLDALDAGPARMDLMGSAAQLAAAHAGLARYAREGLIDPAASAYSINTMGLPAGAGLGRRVYPALYDYVLGHPNAINYADELTPSNQVRRTLNMVGPLEKYGDLAANRLLIHPSQLRTGESSADRPSELGARMIEYGHLPTTSKIGVLNALGAAATHQRLNQALHAINGLVSRTAGNPEADFGAADVEALGQRLRGLGIDSDPANPAPLGELTTDVAPGYHEELSQLLHDYGVLTGMAQPVGSASLRRAAIANDVLGHGLQAGDLDGSGFAAGLARRRGGRVTQQAACSCQ